MLGQAERQPGGDLLAVPQALWGLRWGLGNTSGPLGVGARAGSHRSPRALSRECGVRSRVRLVRATGALWAWLWAVPVPGRGVSRKR